MIQLLNKNNLVWRIRVTFAGKLPPKVYTTADIRNTDPGWASELFKRPIEQLEFSLPTGHRIVLSGMEQYNFFIEAVQSPGKRSSAQIEAFWFCGKLPNSNTVEMWRVGNNKVVRLQETWGHEWCGGPTSGWKPGIIGTYISELRN